MMQLSGAFLWHLKATHGLPLDMAFVAMARAGATPELGSLYTAAEKDGANLARLKREIEFYIVEAYGESLA